MTPYKIITIPDPVLKTVASPVGQVDAALRAQMDRMLETMYDAAGIGLAANQVGLLNRVIVMDVAIRDGGEQPKPIYMINPEIIWSSDEEGFREEGCLSIPGQYAEVQRPVAVRVKYIDYSGQPQEADLTDLMARCAQHEIDHLDGVLFVDHLSSLKRNMIVRRFAKQQRDGEIPL